MARRFLLASLVLPLLASLAVSAEPDAKITPIKEVTDVTPNRDAFKDAGRKKPLVLKSKDDAAKYFDDKNLAELTKTVDFKNQIVLVFAWRGSGGDRLTYVVAESYPEQIFFTLKPGRTRDLRSHTHVYALRSNVKWTVK